MITIEPVTIADFEWFIETAAVRMITEELKRPELVNIANLYTLGARGCESGTAWVAKKDGRNIGALGALLVPNVYNPDFMTLVEMFWWVDPEERNGRAGLMLLKAYDERAKEVAVESTISLLGSSRVSIPTMEKKGWKLGELAFRKEYTGEE